jgi:hypothetical protein
VRFLLNGSLGAFMLGFSVRADLGATADVAVSGAAAAAAGGIARLAGGHAYADASTAAAVEGPDVACPVDAASDAAKGT